MAFDAAMFRASPPAFHGEWSTDPFSGLLIPKTQRGNVEWRQKLIASARSSATVRRALRAAAAKSPIFFANAFAFTFLQKKISLDGKEVAVISGKSTDGLKDDPHIPFITWKVQDDAIVELTKAIDGGYDALIHKTRDMGASWLVLLVFHWYWQFRPSTTFLELSRKESLVDARGNMDSLFEKHRYLLRWQPEWLRPKLIVDNYMHLENRDIGSSIEGESTNENAGQASRKTAILLDEFARVREGEAIDHATADTSACRIFNSTPQGPNTHFTRIYRQMVTGARTGKLIVLPWWQHPDKARGAAIELDESGNEVVTSPWKKFEAGRRSKRNMAQNIDGEHGKSGDAFFDADEIEKHRRAYERPPLLVGNVKFEDDLGEESKQSIVRRQVSEAMLFVENGTRNPWRLWVPLLPDPKGKLRPSQSTRYVFGVDISNGSGASNSVITVLDHQSNMIVAKFWDAFTSPEELADITALAAIWFGGKGPPLVIFEKNGPGVIYGRRIKSVLSYPNIYYQEVLDGKSKQVTTKWGWHSSDSKKEILLGEYRDALKTNAIINPCKEGLDEALDYTYDDKGKIEPGSRGVEEGGGSALHGDHVIADALVVRGRQSLPKGEKPVEVKAPHGTFGHRREMHRQRTKRGQEWAG